MSRAASLLVLSAAALLAAPAAALLCSENPAWKEVAGCSNYNTYTNLLTATNAADADTAKQLFTVFNNDGEPCSGDGTGYAHMRDFQTITEEGLTNWLQFSADGSAASPAEQDKIGYKITRLSLLDTGCEDPVPCTAHNKVNGVVTTDTEDSAFLFTEDDIDISIFGCNNTVSGGAFLQWRGSGRAGDSRLRPLTTELIILVGAGRART
jgi:hypothetical protein